MQSMKCWLQVYHWLDIGMRVPIKYLIATFLQSGNVDYKCNIYNNHEGKDKKGL